MNYRHIGWCKDDKTNADKIWGVIELSYLPLDHNDQYYQKYKFATFWGRRGKKLQTKVWEGYGWDSAELFMKKQDKGYKEIDQSRLGEVYPEFEEDLEKTAVWAMLSS